LKIYLSLLADEVAIVLENARVFDEMHNALQHNQIKPNESIVKMFSHLVKERQNLGYQINHGVVTPLSRASFHSENSTMEDISEDKPGLLSVPISLHGETIGLIQLAHIDPQKFWTEGEISLVKSVADKVGVTLARAQFLEQANSRAEHNSMMAKIANQILSSNDPNEIMQRTVEELRHILHTNKVQIVLPASGVAINLQEDGNEKAN
jgi:GAF domain-containing protein